MKRALNILVITILSIMPIFVDAKMYTEAEQIASKYMEGNDYKASYGRYIVSIPSGTCYFYNKKEYKIGNNTLADVCEKNKFALGGLLSLEEFEITKQNGKGLNYSYLYEGNSFWTRTSPKNTTEQKNIIAKNYPPRQKNNNEQRSGVKVTEYIRTDVGILGEGTHNNPWIFAPEYKVTIKVNDKNKGYIKGDSGEELEVKSFIYDPTKGTPVIFATGVKGQNQYIGSTCGHILAKENSSNPNNPAPRLILTNVTRDFECMISFGEKPKTIKLTKKTGITLKTEPKPTELYLIDSRGWFLDSFGNEQITKLTTNPTRVGYTFKGYDTKEGCNGTKVIDANGKLIEDKTARSTLKDDQAIHYCDQANKYTITFDKNNGQSVDKTTQVMEFDKTYSSYSLPSASRVGYIHKGWALDPEGTQKITSTTQVKTASNHTLYAVWEARNDTKYQVRYWKQKIGAPATQNSTNYEYSTSEVYNGTGYSDSTVPAPLTPIKGFTTPDPKDIYIKPDGTAVLNYYYTRNTYKISFVSDKGTPSFSSKNIQYGDKYQLPEINTEGYTFLGWFTTSSGGSEKTTSSVVNTDSDHTLYAHWKINQYLVTLVKPAKGISAVTGGGTYNYKTEVTINATPATGYHWYRWTGDEITTTKSYKFTLGAAKKAYQANALPNEYTVKYDCNGGTGTTPESKHVYDMASELSAEKCTKTNYTFKGWTVNQDGSGTVYGNKQSVINLTSTNNGVVKLHAKWQDTENPSCSLKVTTSGISFDTKTDNVGVSSYGINKSTNAEYNSKTSISLTTGTVYGHVKDAAGNTARCQVTLANTYASNYQTVTNTCKEESKESYTKIISKCNKTTYYSQTKEVCAQRQKYTETTKTCKVSTSYTGQCHCYNYNPSRGTWVSCTASTCSSTCKSYTGYSDGSCSSTTNTSWEQTSIRSGLSSCSSKNSTCASSSDKGNTSVTCTLTTVYEFVAQSPTTVTSCSPTEVSGGCSMVNMGKSQTKCKYSHETYAFGSDVLEPEEKNCVQNLIECNSSNSGKSKVVCQKNTTYTMKSSTGNSSTCAVGSSFTCNKNNSGKSYISSCTPTAYACNDGYTKLNNSYCYKY